MITLLAATMMASALQSDGVTILYRPGVPIKDQSISLHSWGSGICTETDDVAYEGASSIRITTKNLYQGGTLAFGKSIDLASSFSDKNNLLRITYKPLDMATGSGTGTGGGKKGGGAIGGAGGIPPSGGGGGAFGGGPPGGGGRPGQGAPPGAGGNIGGGAPGGAPQGGAPGSGSTASGSLKTVRLIITTADGKKSEATLPASTSSSNERGWKQIGIPLQAIKGFERTNKIIKEVSFAGDVTTAFYLGDIRIINDKTPIRGEPSFRDAQCSVGQSLTLSATGFGGSSILKYTWDFDDQDGIQVDSEGQTVKFKFRSASNDQKSPATVRKDGVFVVTLTVSDLYGLKESYQTQIKVKVNP